MWAAVPWALTLSSPSGAVLTPGFQFEHWKQHSALKKKWNSEARTASGRTSQRAGVSQRWMWDTLNRGLPSLTAPRAPPLPAWGCLWGGPCPPQRPLPPPASHPRAVKIDRCQDKKGRLERVLPPWSRSGWGREAQDAWLPAILVGFYWRSCFCRRLLFFKTLML